MKKKILSLLLACSILASVGSTALTVNAETTEIDKSTAVLKSAESKETQVLRDYEYTVLDDGTAEITKYTGSDKNVKIPDMIDGKEVTRIGKYAFNNCSKLTSVTIPLSVESIGWGAFSDCSSLNEITIPFSVDKIEQDAFDGCGEKLTIFGYESSPAETYAENNDINFYSLGYVPDPYLGSDIDSDTEKHIEPANPQQGKKGDLDNDGKITSADALIVLRASVGLEKFDDNKNKLADVDGDGTVTSADSLAVLRWGVGLKDKGILIEI